MTTQFFDAEGLATRRDLLGAGIAACVIDNGVKCGRYRVVHRGVYAIGPLSPRGRMVAALLAGGPTAALCFASGLVPFGLIAPRPTIDVAVANGRRGDDQVRFHRLTLDENEVQRRDGLRTTTIERTLLDLAALGTDISLLAHEAIAKHLTTKRKLADTANRHRGRKGAPALLAAAGQNHTRSNLERLFLTFLTENELPPPTTNHEIGPYTVDCLYPEQHLVIEVDEHAHQTAYAFENDRARDRYLVAHNYRVMRVTETSMNRHLAATLRRALTP